MTRRASLASGILAAFSIVWLSSGESIAADKAPVSTGSTATAGSSSTSEGSTTSAPTVEPVAITAEPLPILPGKPLSLRALVSEPPRLDGALSWTVETRQHRGALLAMDVSPDNKLIATGGIDGAIRIWEMADRKLVRTIVGHDNYVGSISWSPDGNTLATAGVHDGTMRLWDAKTGMRLKTFRSPKGYARWVRWSPDGSRLLGAGGHSGWVWMWTAKSDVGVVVIELGQDVLSIDWSPDGERVAATIVQGTVSIVDVATGKASEYLGDATIAHYCVRYSPDGKRLFVGSAGGSSLYDMPGGENEQKLSVTATDADWSPDGKFLCTTTSNGISQIWDAKTAKSLKTFAAGLEVLWPRQEQILGRTVVDVTGWSSASGTRQFQHVVARITPPIWTASRPIITGMHTTELTLWNLQTADKLQTLKGHTGPINDVSWSRDGKTLATASGDRTVRLWEAATGKILATLDDHKAVVSCVSWSPDGKSLASGGYDDKVRLWQPTGKPITVFEGHTKPVLSVVWAPRGNLLASSSTDRTVRIWHVDNKQLAAPPPPTQAPAAPVSPFANKLKAKPKPLGSLATQSSLIIEDRAPIRTLAFSPDGSILAGGSGDEAVRLWQTLNGKPLSAGLKYHHGVSGLSWSADGTLLLVGTNQHAASVWNVIDGKMLVSFQTMAPVDYVTWAPGGSMIVAGDDDGSVRFWDGPSQLIRGIIIDEEDHLVLLASNGNYRIDKEYEPDFIYVLQTDKEQVMLSVAEFAEKYHWKNIPAQVKFTGR